jgi:predicted DNA binding CopG/RHH family protein
MTDKRKRKPLKKMPVLKTDEEAERFVETADLSEYDLSGFEPMHFEFQPKNAQVNLRMPDTLLAALKDHAQKRGMPYQRFIREALERAVQPPRK